MEKITISKFLTCLPFFRQMDDAAIEALSSEVEQKELAAGKLLFSEGDAGDAMYIVASGKIRISMHSVGGEDTTLHDAETGECMGEMSLLTGQLRNATARALEASTLLRLSKTAFDRLAEKYPALLNGMTSILLPRVQQDQANLAMNRLFGKLDDVLLHELLSKMGWRRIQGGQQLFAQGEPGDEMFILVQGRVRLTVEDPDGMQRILGEFGAGECLGEFALLAESGTPENLRTATASATRLTDLIIISRAVFEDLLCQYPQVLLNLTRQIVRRATTIEKRVLPADQRMVITLLPLGDGHGMEDFSRQLSYSLGAVGPVLSLNAGMFEKLYGKAGAAQTPLDHPLSLVINAWLDEREREVQYMLYTASPLGQGTGSLDAWTRRCVEDADLVLLVADADGDPGVTAREAALAEVKARPRVDLVLVHPAGSTTATGTTRWLEPRRAGDFPVQAHYHVRSENTVDFRRLSRCITGTPIGLTLSGGGARGWAHVGVLKALEEAGIEYDWVAGASMGAIVAAGLALDWTSERIIDMAARFSDPKKLLDYTFPYTSFTATKKISTVLHSQYGDGDIEDAWHPFFCISADLTRGMERLHEQGPMWKAVRASMAFPGIFAPVSQDGCVLIDGGAANNLPIDRMRERCPHGTVIGVDLLTKSPVGGGYEFGSSLSGWKTLGGKLMPASRQPKVPHLMNIVSGLVYSNNRYRLNESWRKADLLIKVPVEEFGLLEFEKYGQIIEVGYRAAQEQLKGFTQAG